MPETTRLKLALLIHDLKAPLAVIDLGARSLKERKATYGPLTAGQENSLDLLLRQTESLRREVNSALSGSKGAVASPGKLLRGMLNRLTHGAARSDTQPPRVSAETLSIDAVRELLPDIEAHLHGISETVEHLGNRGQASGGVTVQQARVFRRLRRSAKLSLILIANAGILADSREIEDQAKSVRLSDAIRGPLVEIFDLYNWPIADEVDKFTRAEDMVNLAAKAGVSLQAEAGLLDRQFVLDTEKFGQVMVNLLLNAFKYRKDAVWLSVKEQGPHLVFGVSDDGKGMSEEVRRAVLTGRFQAGPDNGQPIQSHGIGLAGAHVLVREMGGELAIESAPGKGAKVSVSIPCVGGGRGKAEG